MIYTGRFAPSPTGPLHFGSLLAALASFLDARHHAGKWLIRIEDIDTPRVVKDANDWILQTLDAHGLEWDDAIVYQSQRLDLYEAHLNQLIDQQRAYPCGCARSELDARNARHLYDGKCRETPPNADARVALRLRSDTIGSEFTDRIQGKQVLLHPRPDDFVLKRRDGYFAYQLAVVIDDHEQQITHIVRGADLLQETFRQRDLQSHFNFQKLEYAHIPLATYANGQKLSKQNLAPAISNNKVVENLCCALKCLGQNPPENMHQANRHEIIDWAVKNWHIEQIPATCVLPNQQET
ncbi:tRNA glutamyl-Q(34) synthetase GluQRS [Nitrincola alkalisediminis]|uniref:tRNA glutamyl-Q(34) synthetase GluQRS n=1 Tax=Nitrincola alkalisediminis TaxID=1366656 RepID=UPI0018772CB1|nr:tRNA glutamyl-Q(34) synthetase GluQRS [Nitrincola alkalisediminis]